MVLLVVYKSKGRDAAGLQAQVFHHTLWRGKGELAAGGESLGLQGCLKPGLKVVYIQIVVAVEADEVVLVSFVVAHKDVFAVDAAVVAPPALCLLYGLAIGMIIIFKGDVVLPQVCKYCLFSCHSFLCRNI